MKNLVYGTVKTRLAAQLGNDAAFDIYKELLKHTAHITQKITADKYVYYSSTIEQKDNWNNNVIKKVQHGNDLGDKMQNAFEEIFRNEYQQAVIIGSDCMDINSNHIDEAFLKLNVADVVIGPAEDGGYYLLGMKKLHASLFKNINWSSSEVLKQTINICETKKLSYFLLEILHDIDHEKDWLRFLENSKAPDKA